jgi:hypothetical protein
MTLEAWAVYSKLFWVLFVFMVTSTVVNCFIACKCSRIWSSENAYWLVSFKFFGTTQHVNNISDLEITHGGINLAFNINSRSSNGELNIWQWLAEHIMHILGLIHGILFFVTARQQNTEVQYCTWSWASFTHIPFSRPVSLTLPSSHHTASFDFQRVNRQKFVVTSPAHHNVDYTVPGVTCNTYILLFML